MPGVAAATSSSTTASRGAFVERLIVPQASAVWSADPRTAVSFPARFLAEFFANHGMLGFRDRPQWRTVAGGSARYVEALTAPLRERIRLHAPVRSITRRADHVELTSPRGAERRALRPRRHRGPLRPGAARCSRDPSPRERELLGAIAYQPNEAVLHTDSGLLPRRRAARAALELPPAARARAGSTVTYHMNRLQSPARRPRLLRDAQPRRGIDPREDHPHDPATTTRCTRRAGVAAQRAHASISDLSSRTHYCGAYWGWGFHEDGVVSALRACEPFGVKL